MLPPAASSPRARGTPDRRGPVRGVRRFRGGHVSSRGPDQTGRSEEVTTRRVKTRVSGPSVDRGLAGGASFVPSGRKSHRDGGEGIRTSGDDGRCPGGRAYRAGGEGREKEERSSPEIRSEYARARPLLPVSLSGNWYRSPTTTSATKILTYIYIYTYGGSAS